AACCGVVGFKPTYGLVSLEGCFPLAPSFDHAGPMARDVAACELMLEALADGFSPAAPVDLADLTVGLAWTEHATPLVRERGGAAGRAPRGGRARAGSRPGARFGRCLTSWCAATTCTRLAWTRTRLPRRCRRARRACGWSASASPPTTSPMARSATSSATGA